MIIRKLQFNNNKKLDNLPTFIRNRIDHPNTSDSYSYSQLLTSIQLMRDIIINP